MRKTRRHKYFQIALFFLIYSIIHVVSISHQETENDESNNGSENTIVIKTRRSSDSNKKSDSPEQQDLPAKPSVNSTKEHDHVGEKILGHMHNSLGSHETLNHSSNGINANSTKHHEHVAEKMFGHAHSSLGGQERDQSKNSTEHQQHVAETIIKHLHGSIKDKNSTEDHAHVAESVVKSLHGSMGSKNSSENNTAHHHQVAESVLSHLHGSLGGKSSTVTKQYGKENETANGKNETKNEVVSANATNSACTPPAIKQFPHPIMSPTTRRHGGLIIHVLVAIYMFLGLAIVCDEYFVASLDRICEELKMSPDVAGATFMAAGSSAPELATVIIGVFLAQDDIGISGVIGSAVFNIMFVIACCGLCSSVVIYLNWWPLIRDCFFYAVSILVLLVTIRDESITWVESVILLVTYVIYCVALHYNTLLESIAYSLPVPFGRIAPNEQSGLVSYKTLDDAGKMPNYGMDWSPEKQQENADQDLKNLGADWSPEKNQGYANQLSGPALNQATIEASPQQPAPSSRPIQQDYYKPKEYDPSTQVNPLIKPEGAGIYTQVTWAILYPIHWLSRMTMPDCRTEKYKNWYPFTFFISMVWISFYSYFMVWMITLIGYTLYIPDTVMGLTFVAAGVSVPDALSSIAVIKEGYGDMAVSNAVGSNVFDILVCLGLPWFIKTAIVSPGSTVKVRSKGLTYSTVSLLSTVVLLVVATHMNGWKLDRRYGIILMIWYLIFITLASIYEFNVFEPCDDTDW